MCVCVCVCVCVWMDVCVIPPHLHTNNKVATNTSNRSQHICNTSERASAKPEPQLSQFKPTTPQVKRDKDTEKNYYIVN